MGAIYSQEAFGRLGTAEGEDTDAQFAGCFYFLYKTAGRTALFDKDGFGMELLHQETFVFSRVVVIEVLFGEALLACRLSGAFAVEDAEVAATAGFIALPQRF